MPEQQARVYHISEIRYTKEMDKFISDQAVKRGEWAEVARLNKQMDRLGRSFAVVSSFLGLAVIVAQGGIMMGWW